jgi:hypothetical protein
LHAKLNRVATWNKGTAFFREILMQLVLGRKKGSGRTVTAAKEREKEPGA